MLLTIPDVLNAAQVKRAREILNAAEWVDGKVTAGHEVLDLLNAARSKRNNGYFDSPACQRIFLDALLEREQPLVQSINRRSVHRARCIQKKNAGTPRICVQKFNVEWLRHEL